eukprot:CAMPEP_0184672062 /NCGR_PEP_ID=MMETSP0308-20130426/85877_1 /TAXON_ID=38269 /ORGANISM="Gloeochaete witrockiana, Strain SAG 46.84" /LENGTH=93 /DNA_ID=CAMNT_0027119317 /DNA_START=107 /DNA_END=388 /DNA_ORIENTATION=+
MLTAIVGASFAVAYMQRERFERHPRKIVTPTETAVAAARRREGDDYIVKPPAMVEAMHGKRPEYDVQAEYRKLMEELNLKHGEYEIKPVPRGR